MSPVARGRGDGRASQPNFSAAAFRHAIDRARLKPPSSPVPRSSSASRNATGSAFAAAASSSMKLSDANVTCGPSGSRRLPMRTGVSHASGIGTTLPAMRRFGMRVLVRRERRAAARRLRLALPDQLRDQHRVVLVVADVVVVGGAGVVVERDELPLRVEPAAHGDGVGRALRVPRRFFLPRPLHAHRPAELVGQKRRFEAGVFGGGAAVGLRPLHPHDAHVLARDLQELRDAVAHPVRLHVVRVDRQLAVRRIGQRVRGTERGVALERHVVLRLDDGRGARDRRRRHRPPRPARSADDGVVARM